MRRSALCLLVLLAVLFSKSALAGKDPRPWPRAQAPAWSAELPPGWEIGEARWEIASPGRNLVLRLSLDRDPGGDLDALAQQSAGRLARKAEASEVVKRGTLKAEGRDVAWILARTWMPRKKTVREFLTVRMLMRFPKRGRILTATGSATAERVDRLLATLTRVLGSLSLAAGGRR
jgi:hypothetical protein